MRERTCRQLLYVQYHEIEGSAGIYITSYEDSGGNFNAAVDLNS